MLKIFWLASQEYAADPPESSSFLSMAHDPQILNLLPESTSPLSNVVAPEEAHRPNDEQDQTPAADRPELTSPSPMMVDVPRTHRTLKRKENPYEIGRPLGKGASGTVVEAKHRGTLEIGKGASGTVEAKHRGTPEIVACKIIKANDYDPLTAIQSHFQKFAETDIMYKLRGHQHIVNIVETFTIGRELYIIMTPVAETDLRQLLIELRDGERPLEIYKKPLKTAFGCLATALAFIHTQNTRHKGIYLFSFLFEIKFTYLNRYKTRKYLMAERIMHYCRLWYSRTL
jgi:serine/threonine protein kinase